MKFKTVVTLERIAKAVRNSDERALEKVLEDVNAASRLLDNWPFDPRALQLLLVTLLQRIFYYDKAHDDDTFKRTLQEIRNATRGSGFQFNVATLLADLAQMIWEESIPGIERLVLDLQCARRMVRADNIEPVGSFIKVAEAANEALARKKT